MMRRYAIPIVLALSLSACAVTPYEVAPAPQDPKPAKQEIPAKKKGTKGARFVEILRPRPPHRFRPAVGFETNRGSSYRCVAT